MTLTYHLLTSKFIGVIYWPWPILLPSKMTVTNKLFKILSGHGICIKCNCDLDFDLLTSKLIGVIYWPWPIFLPSTMIVTNKNFKILSRHDVANGRTDGCHTIIRPKFHFGRIKSMQEWQTIFSPWVQTL